MTSEELNKLLVKHFPHLMGKYLEEVSWQEGDSTGSHTVYGDVLTPYFVECISKDDRHEMVVILNFLEQILRLNDKYAEEVVAFSVLESTAYLFREQPYLLTFLGENTARVLNEIP